ncbi:uncharacterized protein ACWYII_042441 [Salvelinus alpinus]
MANCMLFHTQIASVMEVLANAAVADICKLVDDDYAVFRLEITQSQKENSTLRRKLQQLELKVARERAEKTIRDRVLARRPNSVKIVDRYRGMARGGHLTGGHRSFVKPAGHNTWNHGHPITVEGTGTSTQNIIVIESADAEAADPGVKLKWKEGEEEPHHNRDIQTVGVLPVATEDPTTIPAQPWTQRSIMESADAEAAGPGVKLEKSEGEEDPPHSRDIQTGLAEAPPVATEDPIITPAQPRTQRSMTEVSGTPNSVLKSETDTESLTVLERLDCPPAPHSKYLLHGNLSPRTVLSHQDSGDALQTGNDPSCSYVTEREMIPGDMPVGLDTQTNPMRGDWNQYCSGVYSEECLDKKGEGLVIDEVTVNVEGDAPLTWNADKTHLGGQPQGNTSDFLNYRESLQTNPNVATHYPLHTLRDRDPVSTSMAPSDSHRHILFDQVLNSNDRARAQAQGRGATSGNSKEKRFLCSFYNKGFSYPQNVEIHTGEKPFSCTQCQMRFAQAGNLKMHLKVHMGERSSDV